PTSGTTMLTAISSSLPHCPIASFHSRRLDRERPRDQTLLRARVPGCRSFRRTRAARAGENRQPARTNEPFERRARKLPCPHVLRLFLCPDDFLNPRIRFDDAEHVTHRQRIELLHSAHRDLRRRLSQRAREQVDGDLAGAEDEAAHIARTSLALI